MQLNKAILISVVIVLVSVNCVFGHKSRGYLGIEMGQDRDPKVWAVRNYPAVLNNLLFGETIATRKFPQNVKWMVTVRILPPFEKPEYGFSMRKTYDGKIEVSVITTKDHSILFQLRILRSKYPKASLEKISELISIERWTITHFDQPQLSHLAEEFEALNISPVLPDELRVDDTGYEFWSESLWGNRMNVILSGPGMDAKKQPHPLLQWAEAVRSIIGTRAKR